jgi:hypothetical protein
MVTFLTLLLGLVIGEHQIELAVDDRVASVEVWLDRALVGVVRGAPWRITCDLGKTLAPHLLEAVARDGAGREIDRAVQRVNLPREVAEVSLALRGGELGYRDVEIAWDAPPGIAPEEIRLYFDGEPLELAGRLAPLPPHDASTMHIVSAELVFAGQLRATEEVAFGGEFGEEVRTDLTAVPLVRRNAGVRRSLPSAGEVEAWLQVAGSAARVVAVEALPFELIVVRDRASLHLLRRLREPARKVRTIEREPVLRFVSSRPLFAKDDAGDWSGLFSVSQNVNTEAAGLGWVMTHRFFAPDQEGPVERLAEAVAVAGLQAAGSKRPRGVLLLTGERFIGEPEPGRDPVAIRGYLSALRVPFFYWRLDDGGDTSPDAWGDPTVIRDRVGLQRAVLEVVAALRPQFLAWLDGQHMPSDVTLEVSSSARVRLAGVDPH